MSNAVVLSPTEYKLSVSSASSATEAASGVAPSRLVAPSLQLLGHKGTCHSLAFSHQGDRLAVACADGHVYLWTFLDEDPKNYDDLPIHTNDVLQVRWSADDTLLVTASADKTARVTDVMKNERVKTLRHKSYVNGVALSNAPANPLILTGSDDKSACLWDIRSRDPVQTIDHPYQVMSVALNGDASMAFTAGLDEVVRVYDVRKAVKPLFELRGHTDSITSLALNSDGSVLASNSMDKTLRLWDIRRAVSQERLAAGRAIAALTGHSHDAQQQLLRTNFAPNDRAIAAGSSDGSVYVWNVMTQQLAYSLPGHKGSVNEAAFHPTLPILASCSNDKSAFIGDLPMQETLH